MNMIQAKEKYGHCQWEYKQSLKILEMFELKLKQFNGEQHFKITYCHM